MNDWLDDLHKADMYFADHGDIGEHADNAITRTVLLDEHARELIDAAKEYYSDSRHVAERGKLEALLRRSTDTINYLVSDLVRNRRLGHRHVPGPYTACECVACVAAVLLDELIRFDAAAIGDE